MTEVIDRECFGVAMEAEVESEVEAEMEAEGAAGTGGGGGGGGGAGIGSTFLHIRVLVRVEFDFIGFVIGNWSVGCYSYILCLSWSNVLFDLGKAFVICLFNVHTYVTY